LFKLKNEAFGSGYNNPKKNTNCGLNTGSKCVKIALFGFVPVLKRKLRIFEE